MNKLNKVLSIALIIIILILIIILFYPAIIKKEYYSTWKHLDEFKQLNKCYSDGDCLLGQVSSGPDIESPSPECFTKNAINKFDDIEDASKLTYLRCSCNLINNSCVTEH